MLVTTWRWAVLLVSAVLVIGSAGCSSSSDEDQVALARGVSGFDDVYTQPLQWAPCEDDDLAGAGAECAVVRVPLDWDAPDRSDRVDIAVSRLAAIGEAPLGSVLFNPGGPGGPGLSLPAAIASQTPRIETLRQSYALIGFDPRGIGESSPIDCEDTSEIAELNFAQCIADNELTHFMGTSSVARDMDVLRVLLGDRALNYLGYSYGTMLGATYAHLFPDLVGKMVLDSAESAGWATPVHGFDQGLAISQALDRYFESCTMRLLGGTECVLNSKQSFQDITEALTEAPLVARDGGTFGGEDLSELVVSALYFPPEQRAQLLAVLSRALGGDLDSIDRLVATKQTSSVGDAGSVVRCHSAPRTPDLVALQQHARDLGASTQKEVDEMITTFGGLSTHCALLPEVGTDTFDTFSAPGVDPILVIGIGGDHATPYQYAQELTRELGTARLLTLDGDGHAASYANSTCIDDAVDAYFLDGVLPDEGARCSRDPDIEDVPTVRIEQGPAGTPTLTGSATAGDRIELSTSGAATPDPARYVDVDDQGVWGPVQVQPGCYELRSVAPGRSSDPVTACIRLS